MAGAKWICQHMGVDEDDFYEAIVSFKGASKRLEKIAENEKQWCLKILHIHQVRLKRQPMPLKISILIENLLACLELHTYSSLNAEFLKEYKGALNSADKAVVFYSPHALEIKRLEEISEEQIRNAFEREDLIIYTNPEEF